MFSNGHVMVMSCLFLQYDPSSLMRQPQKKGYAECERQEKCLRIVQNASFLLFLHFKMAAYEAGYEGRSEKSYL